MCLLWRRPHHLHDLRVRERQAGAALADGMGMEMKKRREPDVIIHTAEAGLIAPGSVQIRGKEQAEEVIAQLLGFSKNSKSLRDG